MKSLGDLLSRLDKVRRTGEASWIARCPAHEDRDPSLTLAERDGVVLLHCFAGCDVASIVGAIGMDLADLFPERLDDHRGQRVRLPFNPTDVLRCVGKESLIASICAAAVGRGEILADEDRARLAVATRRLHDAAEAVRG